MIFGTNEKVSNIVKVISFRDLNRPTIVRDSAIDFGTNRGAASTSVAIFNSRFGSDITFLATRRSDKSLVSSLHFSSDVLSLVVPAWYREVELDGKRERLVIDLTSSGISYECLAEYLYCAFAQTREHHEKYIWIPEEQTVNLENIELIRDMWNLLEIPVKTYGTIRVDSFRRMILSSSKMHHMIRSSNDGTWIKKMRSNIVRCVLTPTEFNTMHGVRYIQRLTHTLKRPTHTLRIYRCFRICRLMILCA